MCGETGDAPWTDYVEQLARQVIGWAICLCERGKSPSTAARYVGALVAHARERGVVWAGKEREVHARVAELAEDFPHEPRRARGFTVGDMQRIVAHLDRSAHFNRYAAMWRALLLLMHSIMLRLGEVADTALRWWMITTSDSGDLQIFLPWRKNRKGALSRALDTYTVPRATGPLDVLGALQSYARLCGESLGRGEGAVFRRRRLSGALASGTLYRWFNEDIRRICKKAGVPHAAPYERLSSHGLRRGGNTSLGATGATWEEKGKLGGWSSQRGQEPYDESGPAVAARMAVLLGRAAGDDPATRGREPSRRMAALLGRAAGDDLATRGREPARGTNVWRSR